MSESGIFFTDVDLPAFMRHVPLFKDLAPEAIAHLLTTAAEMRLSRGADLFEEGSPGEYAYVIVHGEIEIYTTSGHREITVAVRTSGEVIGEMSLMDNAPRVASARARTDSMLLIIFRKQFHHLLRSSPGAAREILYTILPRWRNTEHILRQREQEIREQSHTLEETLEALRRAHDHLEQRVSERTAELAQANAILQEQMRERERAERELQDYREHLEELVESRTSALEAANRQLRALNERMHEELATAQRIQRGLLPSAQPGWDSPTVICYSTPAREVGGDFYAYHAYNTDTFAVAVGDVSGKGMPAALLMAVSLTSFQRIVSQRLPPGQLLNQLDDVIAPYTHTTRQNCALCCAQIEHDVLRVANAGCVMPLLLRIDGTVEWIDVGGMPLGVNFQPRATYGEATSSIRRGDLLILTSDGVIESTASDREMFGFDRLETAVLAGPRGNAIAMLAHLRNTLSRFTNGREPHDDVTILVVQR